jgi:hypothetical protein
MPAARNNTAHEFRHHAITFVTVALLVVALLATTSNAQSARRADQFYTNGAALNAWTAISQQKRRTTFWFVLHPADSAAYRQMLAIIYDDRPDYVYYVDSATRLFVGRLDLNTDDFSLLPPDSRRGRLQDIPESAFPTPGDLPRVADMFEPLPAGARSNPNRMLLPPPTLQHPRLRNSTWDTCYMSADRFRIRSTLELENDRGTYRLRDKPGTGVLSNIQYDRDDENHLIHGQWVLGQSRGWFKFTVPEENLNVFWGEFGFEAGRIVGAWDGIRRSRPALKDREKPLR